MDAQRGRYKVRYGVSFGGGCRQSGREFRLEIPSKPFFRTTDLFEDGDEGTF